VHYRFAGLELDADRLELSCGGEPIALQPKSRELLLYLVRNSDRTVTKSELFERVWPGTRTVESALTRAMALLRAALETHASEPVIETVRGTGYRIAVSVAAIAPTPEPSLATGREPVFLGRERELAELLGPLAAEVPSGARLCVLSGEAGIGKTALARELTARARALGARVVWGRCDPAREVYGPWREILRAELGEPDAIRALRRDGTRAGALALGVPELRRVSAAIPGPPALDPERARRAFFAAVIALQAELAARAPLWLVIDDAHWADRPSVLLLSELVAASRELPLSVLVTRRELEPEPDAALEAELARLARSAPRASLLRLGGLLEPELEQLIEQIAGGRLRSAELRAIHTRASGNPLFARELVRLHLAEPEAHWPAHDAPAQVPTAVRALVRRRLAPLPVDSREALGAASVLGRAFGLAELASLLDRPASEVLVALAPAERARAIEPGVPHEGDFRFVHELFRESLYEDLPAAERVRLHRRAAENLEASGAAPDLAALARHYGRAALDGDCERALDFALHAAAQANARLAFESAAEQLEAALALLDRHIPGDSPRRAALLLELGEAQIRSGEAMRAEASWWQAVNAARASGAIELAAHAAIRLSMELLGSSGRVPAARIEVLEYALRELPEERLDLRSLVLSALATDLQWGGRDLERARELSARSLALARESRSERALLVALDHRYVTLCRGEDFGERVKLTEESLARTRGAGDARLRFSALIHDVALRTARADLSGARSALRECDVFARELAQPWFADYVRTSEIGFDLLAGRVERAADRIEAALRAQAHDGPRDLDSALLFLSAQLFQLRRLQGRLPEQIPALREACPAFPDVPAFRACLALACLVAGKRDEARAELERAVPLDGGSPLAVRDDAVLAIQLALLGEVCAEVGDERRTRALEAQLQPFERHYLVLSTVVAAGSADRVLGALAASRGELPLARKRFARARALDDAVESAPWQVLTELAWARAETRAGQARVGSAHRKRACALAHAHRLDALAREADRN